MLSAQAYSFRMKSRLAISLSWIGGYANVVAVLATAHVVSHVTGNTTMMVEQGASGHWDLAWQFAFLVGMFFIGSTLSALLIESARRRGSSSKYVMPMLTEAMLLTMFAWLLYRHDHVHPLSAMGMLMATGIVALAMGLQNATITSISGAVIRTTHLTGVVTDLGLESVQLLWWWWDRTRTRRWSRTGKLLRVSQRHPTVLRIALLASIFGSFAFGVAAGTLAGRQDPALAMLVPVCFVLWICYVDKVTPIADVREIDQLADPDLRAAGLVRHLLPAELGVYRLFCHHHGKQHRSPNLSAWVEGIPTHRKVVILAMSPLVRLDGGAVDGLRLVVRTLQRRGQRLILAGMTGQQFAELDRQGFDRLLPPEDMCPDLEFAIARGVGLLGIRELAPKEDEEEA